MFAGDEPNGLANFPFGKMLRQSRKGFRADFFSLVNSVV